MSTAGYSHTDTTKNPDPYRERNLDEEGVSLKTKVEDLLNFIEGQKFGMMTTRQSDTGFLVSRCMALAARQNGVDLLFHTNTETHKTDELAADPHINMSFIRPSTGEWASISGIASIETDREMVKKYYSPELKSWVGDLGDGVHDGSANDPRIGIIKINAKTATYTLSKGNALSRTVEVAKGAVTGKVASVNKMRDITEAEFQQYRATAMGDS